MKKEYKQPQVEVFECMDNTILAGTLEVKKGNTNEQCAKSNNMDFEFEDEDEEDFLSISSNNQTEQSNF